MIENEADMLKTMQATTREGAERNLYEYSNCGAWIEFLDYGIRIGSIVEGCEFDTATYPLTYPFSEKDYSDRVEAIEAEAKDTWKWANESDGEHGTPMEEGCDAPDTAFEYQHLNPESF
jgi:hypothetical protein